MTPRRLRSPPSRAPRSRSPREVARLYDLAYNLWWTWSPGAHLLFSAIDPARWVRTRNPVELLLGVEPHMWDALLQNESFMSGYHTVIGEFDRYLAGRDAAWFRKTYPSLCGRPGRLPLDGVRLARMSRHLLGRLGDPLRRPLQVRERSRDSVRRRGIDVPARLLPAVDRRGRPPAALLPRLRPPQAPVAPGRRTGRQAAARRRSSCPDARVQLRVWKATIGRVPVLLLDSDVRENDPAGPADHLDPLRPRARDAALPGDGSGRRRLPRAWCLGHRTRRSGTSTKVTRRWSRSSASAARWRATGRRSRMPLRRSRRRRRSRRTRRFPRETRRSICSWFPAYAEAWGAGIPGGVTPVRRPRPQRRRTTASST